MSVSGPGPDSETQWFVLFDAVGTVIYPRQPVAETYFRFGSEFGSRLKLDEVQSRFLDTRQSVFSADDVHFRGELSIPSSDEIEKLLWFELVRKVFVDVPDIDALFGRLWNYYSQPDHWLVYDDVPACLASLVETGARIGLASNFDSRLAAIVNSEPALQKFDWVFYSSAVGFRKPDSRFYKAIESTIVGEYESDLTPRFLMVGDHQINDVLAPARLGWSSILLSRTQPNSGDDSIHGLQELAEKFAVILDSTR
jgi:putative hydrolase of the HAD superfamily